jgi:phosphatidylglycerol:prolipoprotein diacylglycerol transferase
MTWNIDPILLQLGPLTLSWYGLFFAGGFLVGYKIMQWIYGREGRRPEELDVLLWYVLIGTVVGMRLVHCLIYDPAYYLAHPLEIFQVWKGGYASHGGAAGVVTAVWFYCRPIGRPAFLWLLDRLAIAAVIAGAFIRVGNFFNSEIVGLPTDSVFGVVFARLGPQPLHPVQLYEATAYFAIFGVMWAVYRRSRAAPAGRLHDGLLSGMYFTLVFGARFILEFLKQAQAKYEEAGELYVGQYMSLPFIALGLFLWIRAARRH